MNSDLEAGDALRSLPGSSCIRSLSASLLDAVSLTRMNFKPVFGHQQPSPMSEEEMIELLNRHADLRLSNDEIVGFVDFLGSYGI